MTEHALSLTALADSLKNGAHSIFSASGSGLWLNCAGGLLPGLLASDDSGVDAAEGTVAHGCSELWLRTKVRPNHLVGTIQRVTNDRTHFDIEITSEMLDHCEVYFDWCTWLPGQHFVETKVYYSQITPIDKQGGTADHVACSWQKMVITDLKFGKGHFVEVKGNTQALLYALGFFYEYDFIYDFQTIELRICQPRMQNMDTWVITRAELLAFAEDAKIKAHRAWALDAPRTPGEKQCQFCRVKATCAPHLATQIDMTQGIFDDLFEPVTVEQVAALKNNIKLQRIVEFTDVYKLTTEEMVKVYAYRSLFEGWWKSLHNELNIRAAAGEFIPGMKLVESRSFRKIKNERVALGVLEMDYGLSRKDLIKEEFLSPAAIEKLLRKSGVRAKDLEAVLDPLVYRPRGKPTLVSEADRRPSIVDLTEIAFADLDIENLDPETEEY